MNTEQTEIMLKLSYDILNLSRSTLLVHLRFLDMALSVFKLEPTNKISFGTDGEYLYFNPMHVLMRYKDEREAIVRDYLHAVMHCVFRHMYVAPFVNKDLWNLSCDIAVENIITELDLRDVAAQRQTEQQQAVRKLRDAVNYMTAEKIYRYLLENTPSESELMKLQKIFWGDDHTVWYLPPDSDSGNMPLESREETEATWKTISERMQVDMETFAKERGDHAGSMMQNLKAVNREKYDYTAFLKKFAVMGETMKINDDEFDYVFYTYGLKLYEKMPLIEPLEYKDVKRMREFVIVLDTSGSVSGELVQTFINKTYNILKNTESFFSKINLYIIQCDAEIQEVVKITSQDEFDDYIKNMKLHGFGGTDFRPAFGYIDELVKSGAFSRLKGIIYFTDGWGIFPEKKPAYDAAFVFIRQDYFNPNVPPWAIKLILDKEDI